MPRLDFYSVINTIIAHCRENMYTTKHRDRAYNNCDLISDIFADYYDNNDDAVCDAASVSRWVKGTRPLPNALINHYRENGSDTIGGCFEDNCVDNGIVYDLEKLYESLAELVSSDFTLSESKKNELLTEVDFSDESSVCVFIGDVIFAAIDRPFISADKPPLSISEIAVADYIVGTDVPKPCRYFCGRDNELDMLHTTLSEHSKVFISGFAGIGKSEFAKAYANKYKSEYKNILYFSYCGDLKKMITEMEMTGDSIADSDDTLFLKHLRLIKSLRSDSLIIIDNYNVSGAGDSFLTTLLNYGCKMIITTRNVIESGYTFALDTISDNNTLYDLIGKYYAYADKNKETIFSLIEAVHHHTLSVEMIGKLLDKGINEPDTLLEHLQKNSADTDSSDKVKITKDGNNKNDTYYNHVRTLFSLSLLDEDRQGIMRSLVLFDHIRIRYLAKALGLSDTNSVNELIETGLIQNNSADNILLHPMIRDIAVLDLKPNSDNCSVLFSNISNKLLHIGTELTDSEILIAFIENAVKYLNAEISTEYLHFLETAFTFLDNYKKYDLMGKLLSVAESIIASSIGSNNNKALHLNNKAMLLRYESKFRKAATLMNEALELCDNGENPVLFANLNMNIGLLYIDLNDKENGLAYMDRAFLFIKLCGSYNDDMITIATNYATVLTENKLTEKALNVLEDCSFASEGCCSNNHARMIYSIGALYVQMNNRRKAVDKFNEAFSEYDSLGCDSELTARKMAAAQLLQKYGFDYPKEWETSAIE